MTATSVSSRQVPPASVARLPVYLRALDVLADPAVLAAARAEFEAAGGVLDLGAVLERP